MRNDKLTELIFSQQLVSVMNRTKWRELAHALTSNEAFEPTVRLGYISGLRNYSDTNDTVSFYHLDWQQVWLDDERIIKWLKIDPVRRDYVGRLVAPQEIDFSDWVREILVRYAIPFVEESGLFHIEAYLQPAAKPA